MFSASADEKAYFTPFAVFLGFLGLNELVAKISDGMAGAWWWSEPRLWVFPLQTLVCGWLLLRWWRHYELKPPARPAFAVGVGALVLAIWIAPEAWLHFPARLAGFDPTYFGK